MSDNVRLRFAPSPTGGLHLGGVRTALFSYLFAKHHHGAFVLRIEDTDRNRFVEGAEEYITNSLVWCGIVPDESPEKGGDYGPYRQSERKANYRQYAEQLVENGYAYYAFDTKEDLEKMRADFKSDTNPSPQYDKTTRMSMNNSLTLSAEETTKLLDTNTPHVIRIKVPENESIRFNDMIRGDIANDSNLLDDKVLLKADNMPTYHLAVVIDDYLMKISHVFRGEEWLPSAPIHVLLWKYLGWEDIAPQWAHLPLILKPDGKGKLSKRDGERLGFPVFPLSWDGHEGYKERGFLADAFVNMLAALGWNDGTENEMFSLAELIEKFDSTRINKAGAKFNYEKALWYNAEYVKQKEAAELLPAVQLELKKAGLAKSDEEVLPVLKMVQERITLLPDAVKEMHYFFQQPTDVDEQSIQGKWSDAHATFYAALLDHWGSIDWNKESLETTFKEIAKAQEMKIGAVMLPFRVMLVGGKFGPGVFDIAQFLGFEEVKARVSKYL